MQKHIRSNGLAHREYLRFLLIGISGLMGIMWIVVWASTVGFEALVREPLCSLGLIWPPLLSFFDVIYLSNDHESASPGSTLGATRLQSLASTVIGIAFAVGSLLASPRFNSDFARSTTPLLVYSILLLIAFLIPVPALDLDDDIALIIGVIQRNCFNYAIGFLLGSLALNVSESFLSHDFSTMKRISDLVMMN